MISQYEIDGFIINTLDDESIKVENKSNKNSRISFFNPVKKFWGFNEMNFNSGMWVSTQPKKWPFDSVLNKLDIIISLEDVRYIIEYDYESKIFTNKTDIYHNFVNFVEISKSISILIPAFDVVDYIDETIDAFQEIQKKYSYLDIKILVGIDGCSKTFKHLSKKVYPENTTILLSEKNYGEPIMKNSLVKYCETEKFIIFDSDDIPKENMVNIIWDKLETCDVVHYRSINFIDKLNNYTDEGLTESTNVWGGTFGSKKHIFENMNGFFPWKVQADDEFLHRIVSKINPKNRCVCEEPMFFYRMRNNSSSRDITTRDNSFLRQSYKDIMSEKNMYKNFENPNRFYFRKLLYIQ